MNNSCPEIARDQQMVHSVWPEWELVEPLGSGQYGLVYKAQKQSFVGCSFSAVKVIAITIDEPESSFSALQKDSYLSSVARNYVREIKTMESVKGYSNIVNIEDYSVISGTGGQPWYILIRMELLVPLYGYLEGRNITDEQIIHIGKDLCKALEICASRKIVHRDIKPGNVFVNEAGVFKLGDFGIARQILDNTFQTRIGTPDFMAPEVYNDGLRTADFENAQSADIYSLGMLLYWLANEKRMPFIKQEGLISADDISNAFARRMSGEKLPDPINASVALGKVILKACAFNPSDRYKTAGQLEEALTNIHSGNPKRRKKHTGFFILTAAVCIAILIGYVKTVFFPGFPVPSPTIPILPTAAPDETDVSFADPPATSPTVTGQPAASSDETGVPFSGPPTSSLTNSAPFTASPTHVYTPYTVSDLDSAEETRPWPIMDLSGVPTKLKPLGQGERHQSYIGPDRKKYPQTGGFKPAQVSSAVLLFREGDFILTDISYPSSGIRRCVYFPASAVSQKINETVSFTPYAMKITKDIQPRLGPGNLYDQWELSVLKSGMEVNVLFESDNWAFVEYPDASGFIRAWLPVDSIGQL